MSELIGKELGPYRILEQIGTGGMATVYKAYHPATDRYVAVKILSEQMSGDNELRKRFQRECKVIAKLEHARILPVYDYGHAGDRLYLVTRYIEAGTLKERLVQGPMNLAHVSRTIGQVGEALAYAHRLGVVHRDVKPSNVLLDAEGDCYLTDFGLARILEASARLTATGVGVGTPAYMSPEQGQGEKVDERSDVYSLGVMLYEMATGQVPYQAETPLAVVLKHITAPLPLPREVQPDTPEAVERVILKAMAKSPDDRFQAVGEMVAALDAAVRLAQAEMPTEMAVPEPAPAERVAPQRRGRLARTAARVREATATKWGRMAMWATVPIVALLILYLVLSRVPLQVQIRDGQLEVVRIVERTQAPATTPTKMATSTATATPTVLSQPSATPMPTEAAAARATATPTARSVSAAATPTPAYPATVSPAEMARAFAESILSTIAERQPDYEDSFGDPGSGWPMGSTAAGDAWGYEDGAFFISLTPLYADAAGNCALNPSSERVPWFSDFVLEVDAQFVSGERGHWDVGFRQSESDNSSYWMDLLPDGGFELHKTVNGDGVSLVQYQDPSILKQGFGTTNHLTIIAQGPRIVVYVNGELLCFAYDESLSEGRITLGVSNRADTPLRVHFDNLRIWDIADLPLPSEEASECRIVYGQDGDIYVRNCDGSGEQRLTDHPAEDWSPSWSPDGTRIVFNSDRDATHAEGYQIYTMNADGSDPSMLTTRTDRNAKSASWSPDGRRIAFHSYCELVVIDADGASWTVLVERGEDLCPDFPTWSPDGRRIAFKNMTLPDDGPPVKHDIYVVNSDGSGLLKLASLTSEDWNRHAVWSPDGRQIAFDVLVDGQERYYAVDVDGSGEPVEISAIPDSWYPWTYPQWGSETVVAPTPVSGSSADQARAFAEPILTAIADRSPDYGDDFGDPSGGWPPYRTRRVRLDTRMESISLPFQLPMTATSASRLHSQSSLTLCWN
jgi:tRNA A-37 threonylcarbamoyl transferase component Bud32